MRELSSPANAAAFRAQWVRHIRDYVLFVDGLVVRSAGRRTAAAVDLGDFVRDNSRAAVPGDGGAGRGDGARAARPRRRTLTVIRLQAARDPRQFTAAAVGALHFAAVGDAVAASAAERLAVEG